MRRFLRSGAVICLTVLGLAGAEGQGDDASKVLSATRQALGGDSKLEAVKTFVATGRTRQLRGNNLVPIEFEVACELPDKYVRRDEIPAQESGPTSSGFNGENLIQVPPPPPLPPPPAGATTANRTPPPPVASPAPPSVAGRAGGPPAAPPDPRRARVASLKQDFARLTLGMFAASFSSHPLTFTFGGQAEAPQGKADIIDVKGPGTFAVRLFINSETHLPIMLSWTMPAANVVLIVPGQPPPENVAPGSIRLEVPPPPAPTATKEEKDKYAAAVQALRMKALKEAKPVEYRFYYADYRDAGNGVKFPFRLRRAIGADTVEEMNFDSYKINPRIDSRKFEVVK